MTEKQFEISSSPHIHRKLSTDRIMLYVIIALLPSCLFGIFQYGWRALVVLLVSVVTSVGCEWLFSHFVFKKDTIRDLSAVVTGLIVGMNMPSTIPLFVPFLASAFAIVVVKEVFGGLGQNFANPALVGRIFVFFSFTTLMSTFAVPRTLQATPRTAVVQEVDAISLASPLTVHKTALSNLKEGDSPATIGSNTEYLATVSYPYTAFAENVSNSTGINPYVVDAFIGNQVGCVGETSALLILIGGIFLIAMGIISWHIPVCYLLSYGIIEWILGGFVYGAGAFHGDVIYSILTGGVMLSAFFMATDYVSSPITKKGKIVYGIALGLFTFLFRRFSSLPEGASVALLLCNVISPTIDKFVRNKVYGVIKLKKKAKAEVAK